MFGGIWQWIYLGKRTYTMVAGISQNELIQIGIITLVYYLLVQLGKALIKRSIRKTYSDPSDDDAKITGLLVTLASTPTPATMIDKRLEKCADVVFLRASDAPRGSST